MVEKGKRAGRRKSIVIVEKDRTQTEIDKTQDKSEELRRELAEEKKEKGERENKEKESKDANQNESKDSNVKEKDDEKNENIKKNADNVENDEKNENVEAFKNDEKNKNDDNKDHNTSENKNLTNDDEPQKSISPKKVKFDESKNVVCEVEKDSDKAIPVNEEISEADLREKIKTMDKEEGTTKKIYGTSSADEDEDSEHILNKQREIDKKKQEDKKTETEKDINTIDNQKEEEKNKDNELAEDKNKDNELEEKLKEEQKMKDEEKRKQKERELKEKLEKEKMEKYEKELKEKREKELKELRETEERELQEKREREIRQHNEKINSLPMGIFKTETLSSSSEILHYREKNESVIEGVASKRRFFCSCFWVERYFLLLKSGHLLYFRDKDSNSKLFVNLRDVIEVNKLNEIGSTYQIEFHIPDRNIRIAFKNKEVRDLWHEDLKKVLEKNAFGIKD
ncbi:hypothetical protein DMUE_3052 [Dictyocoela muelleri]|nr:hypothetical protein DMUE_3052 [Dictyocoela muelleri]